MRNMVQVTFRTKSTNKIRCKRRRASGPRRVIVGDMVRERPLKLYRFFHKVPFTIYHLGSDTRDSRFYKIVHPELRNELPRPLSHLTLRDRRQPLLAGEFEKVSVVEERELVRHRLLQHFPNRLSGISEKALVSIGSCDRDSIRTDLPPTISPHDPVRVQERKLGMLSHSVNIPGCQIAPFFPNFPVFASKIEIAIIGSNPEHVS